MIPVAEKTITIPVSEYHKLLEASTWLNCLEEAGVDNWEGISFAFELSEELENEDGDD